MKARLNLRNVAVAVGVGYLILLAATAPGRMCKLNQCVSHAWDFIGDAVWLVDLDRWQTLFTGGITIVAAFIGGWFVKQQIDAADAHEKERRRRVFTAARTMMTHTLAALSEYLDQCGAVFVAIKKQKEPRPDFPKLPSDVISQLSTMVEASDDMTAAPFKRLIKSLQVFDSRINGARLSAANCDPYILNAMTIHAEAMMLFSFAREETDDLPTVGMIGGQFLSSLRQIGFTIEDYPELYRAAAQRVVKATGENAPPSLLDM